MCAFCSNPDSPEGVEAASFIAGGMATMADAIEQQNDITVRLACLRLAVEVKGKPTADGNPASSQDILRSAHAYYNFVTNKTKEPTTT